MATDTSIEDLAYEGAGDVPIAGIDPWDDQYYNPIRKKSSDDGETELAKLAQEQWADYKLRYQPGEYTYASKLISERPGEKARAISSSVANAQNMASNLSKGIDNSLGISGISPSSMRSMGAKNDMSGELGGKAGLSAGSSDLAMGDKRMSGILQAIRQGRGMASNSVSGLTSSAISQAQNDALEQSVKNSISNSNWGLAGSLAGTLGGMALRNWPKQQQQQQPQTMLV